VKVLILSHMYPSSINPIYGIFVHEQAKELRRQGCEVRVVSPVPWSPVFLHFTPKWRSYSRIPRCETIDDIIVYHPRYFVLPRNLLLRWSGYLYAWAVQGLISKIYGEFPFEIIHAHSALPDGFGALLMSQAFGTPLVLTIHGRDLYFTVKRSRACKMAVIKGLGGAQVIVAVSSRIKRLLTGYTSHPDRVVTIHNGVDPTLVANAVDQQGCTPRGDKKIILSVGSLIERKGIDIVLRALVDLVKRFEGLSYVVVGDGIERGNLERQMRMLGLGDMVTFLGERPHFEVFRHMSACDVFVLPSWDEAFGVVYVEAMACGKPVIACRGEGVEDIVTHGETGLLVEPRDEESLKEALVRLLSDGGLREKMGEKARGVVLKNFTWEKNAQETIRLYREILRS